MFGVRSKLSLTTLAIASWLGLYMWAPVTTFTPLAFAVLGVLGFLALAAFWVKA